MAFLSHLVDGRFRKRDEEVKRVLAAYKEAIRRADALDDGSPVPAASAPTTPPPSVPPPTVVSLPERPSSGPRRLGEPIHKYTYRELKAVEQEIRAEGRLLTDEELIREMSVRLGYEKLGPRIRERLAAVVAGRDVAPPAPQPRPQRSYYRRRGRGW